MNYYIGEFYKYPESDKLFKLKKKVGNNFIFECGHWCTDSVFLDLIRVKTGEYVYEGQQQKLF